MWDHRVAQSRSTHLSVLVAHLAVLTQAQLIFGDIEQLNQAQPIRAY